MLPTGLLLACLPLVYGLSERDVVAHILADYDKDERPHGKNDSLDDGGPVVINSQVFVRSIYAVDDVNMKISVQVTLRGTWTDDRLAFEGLANDTETVPENIALPNTSPADRQIWIPDTFVQNEREASKHDVVVPNILLRVHPDGKVFYSERLSLELDCVFDLKNFPFDEQECHIHLESYARTADAIVYEWGGPDPTPMKTGVVKTPSFELTSIETDRCDSATNTGVYSCIRATFKLQRKAWYYVLQLYVPTTMLVIVAWLVFSLDKKSTTARLLLALASLALIIALSMALNSRLPPTSYAKSTDVWIGVCLAYVFYALLETVIVSSCADTPRARKNEYNQLDQTTTPAAPALEVHDRRSRLDLISRILYPLFFTVFVAFYVLYYAF